MSTGKACLWELASQNHYAARKIQSLYRGHRKRRELWSYDGILTAAAVVKIQRVYRGHRGRKRARDLYIYYLTQRREVIRGLCRCWKARRVLRIKKAQYLNQMATMLQCAYRSRASRMYFEGLKQRVLERRATRIQQHVRGYLARIWVKSLWVSVEAIYSSMRAVVADDVRLSNNLGCRMTLETIVDIRGTPISSVRNLVVKLMHSASSGLHAAGVETVWGSDGDRDRWDMLHLALCHLVGTGRADFSVDLLYILLARFPGFLPALFCLLVALLYSWCAPGNTAAKLVREDQLEEAVAILLTLQRLEMNELWKIRKPLQQSAYNKNTEDFYATILNKELKARERTPSADFLLTLEKSYFWNGFRVAGCNARTLSLMSCFVIAKQFCCFGGGMRGHANGSMRADIYVRLKRLLVRTRDKTAYRDAESISLRMIVFENLFENSHELVLKQRLAFRDLKEDVEDEVPSGSSSSSKRKSDSTRRRPVSLDVECFRCGEMLMISGSMVQPSQIQPHGRNQKQTPTVIEEKEEDRERTPLEVYETICQRNRQKWSSNGSLSVRPLILLPSETSHVYEVAVKYYAKALDQTELDIRNKPKWKLLAEYAAQGVRLVSCGRGRPDHTRDYSDASVARLTFPFIEYRRQERNGLRVEEHCAKVIQRAFRGFQGRSLWKRLHMGILDRNRQIANTNEAKARKDTMRARRFYQASLIQSRVKGWIHRRKLRKMNRACLIIQCVARCRQARLKVVRERRRRAGGPEVVEMLRRGIRVSNHSLSVVVYRCGGSYKIVGHDLINARQYMGYIYEPEISKLLDEHNLRFEGDTRAAQMARVMPWQHMRVVEVLLQNISLTTPITSMARELGRGGPTGRKSELEFVLGKAYGSGIEEVTRSRILPDQAEIVKQYEQIMSAQSDPYVKKKKKSLY
mmetsp:Transcript_15787/g.23740  ORF Transcript_15787/g.23740 Transcript_15787/m.23740 type:complete len:917 (-) Transcript_15787:179-2929(-)